MKCIRMVGGEVRKVSDAEARQMVDNSCAEYVARQVWKDEVRDKDKDKVKEEKKKVAKPKAKVDAGATVRHAGVEAKPVKKPRKTKKASE